MRTSSDRIEYEANMISGPANSLGALTYGVDVLVIIPSCEALPYAFGAVDSLKKIQDDTKMGVECLLIDDASVSWDDRWWAAARYGPHKTIRFQSRGGLSRSWNRGLQEALACQARYVVCTNSDVLFSNGWLKAMLAGLDMGFGLVGPLTNAPGHCTWQHVSPFLGKHENLLDDSPIHIEQVSAALQARNVGVIEAPLNGFFLMSTTETWWRGRHSQDAVFNPGIPLKGNEVELQQRWRELGIRTGLVATCYIFHYRSVSRPEGLTSKLGRGAFRSLTLERSS